MGPCSPPAGLTITLEPLPCQSPQQGPTVLTEGRALVIVDFKSVWHVNFESLLVELKERQKVKSRVCPWCPDFGCSCGYLCITDRGHNENAGIVCILNHHCHLSSPGVMSEDGRQPSATVGEGAYACLLHVASTL